MSEKFTKWEEFEKSVYAETEEFPTPQESIEEIYLVDWEKPSYVRFADMAIEVRDDEYYTLSEKQLKGYQHYSPAERLIKSVSRLTPLYRIYLLL